MRKLVANFFISLDGVVESPDQWHFPYFDEEMGEAVGAGMAAADAMLMGRVLYQEWADYWPEQSGDEPFADHINAISKYVLSTTLDTVEWRNSTLIRGDVATEIGRLKEQPGQDIAMSGSISTVQWLLKEGLLDELRLLVHPIVVGGGMRRLFPEDYPRRPLRLVDSATFKSGVLYLTYRPA